MLAACRGGHIDFVPFDGTLSGEKIRALGLCLSAKRSIDTDSPQNFFWAATSKNTNKINRLAF
jgi:hypothetical protein